MRVALLIVTLALASLGWNRDARAELNCFETPGEGSRCACIGANDLHRDEKLRQLQVRSGVRQGRASGYHLQLQSSASLKSSHKQVVFGPRGQRQLGRSALASIR
jgi:hypothetical protein